MEIPFVFCFVEFFYT